MNNGIITEDDENITLKKLQSEDFFQYKMR